MKKIFLALFLLISFKSLAVIDQYKQSLSSVNIASGASFTVEDARYPEMASGSFNFTVHKVDNQVKLAVATDNLTGVAGFSTTVNLRITYSEWDGSNFIEKTQTTSLSVNYSTSGNYKDKSIHRLSGGHKLKIDVLSVDGPTDNVYLQGLIEVERYDDFNANYTIPAANLTATEENARGELLVSWQSIQGAQEYDLEWTWVNDYGPAGQQLALSKIPIDKNLFRTNSTRVTIVQTEYAIPLIYDRGYVLYRIRPIGRGGADFRIPVAGKWSFEPQNGQHVSDAPHRYLTLGHQNNLNWQSSVSFAEEGKNKAAISYFDGSLRNRQVVSRLNTEDKIIVGETMYDHQGRGAVQVLPVPGGTEKIGYQRSFNINEDGVPYSREDFDKDLEDCVVSPPGMSASSGASNYYSPENPDKEGMQAFLPDAEKYPFTQVEYTPDNTGRIRRQSGVGANHKLGSGHETKYFYGKPAQEELDMMFGSDAGEARHYKKNMVMDANKQVSVSYLDMQGRIVATSLAGETPANLESISKPEDEKTVTVDLLGKSLPNDKTGTEDALSIDGRSRFLSREMLISQDGTRNFSYELQLQNYSQDCTVGTSLTICYDCVVDLDISLTDECGNLYIPGIGSDGSTRMRVGLPDLTCDNSTTSYSTSFSTLGPLGVGNYNLNRTISINEEALDIYTRDFLSKQGNCFLSFEYFLNEEAKNISIFDCQADCQACLDAVGDYSDYKDESGFYTITEDEYFELLDQCDILCKEDLVQCENSYNMLLADMSPYGQYGLIMDNNSVDENGTYNPVAENPVIEPEKFPLSIFNENNQLPTYGGQRVSWRTPFSKTDQNINGYYLNEDGTRATIDVYAYEDGEEIRFSVGFFEDGIATPGLVLSEVKAGDIFQVYPHRLGDVKDFITRWRPEWAEQLVDYHPEYPYYEYCVEMSESHLWDTKWLSFNSLADAQNAGFFNPNTAFYNPSGASAGYVADPYFSSQILTNSSIGGSTWNIYETKEKEAFQRALFAFASDGSSDYNLWEAAFRTVNCPNDNNSGLCNSCPLFDGRLTNDAEWNTFKSQYYSLKQQFQERKRTIYAIKAKAFNGCIGGEDFNPFKLISNNFSSLNFHSSIWQLFNSEQPCNWNAYKTGIYDNKDKRFPPSSESIGLQDYDEEACYTSFDDDDMGAELADAQKVTCSQSIFDIIERAKDIADTRYLETCGQCPIVLELVNFLSAVAGNDGLDANNVLLSCYPESKYGEFSGNLEEAFQSAFPGEGRWMWYKESISASGDEIAIKIAKEGEMSGCIMNLKILDPGYRIQDVNDLCCINYTETPQYFTYEQGKNFFVKGSVDGSTEKVRMEGKISCLSLNTCTLVPKCSLTKEASELQTLFNALLFDFDLTGEPDQDFFSLDPVPLFGDEYGSIVEGTLANGPTGGNWTWRSDIVGNVFMGYIEDDQGGQCVIELRQADGQAIDFTRIVSFENIRPDYKHPDDPERNFFVSAIIKTEIGNVKVKLKGYSGCFRISSCEWPQVPGGM